MNGIYCGLNIPEGILAAATSFPTFVLSPWQAVADAVTELMRLEQPEPGHALAKTMAAGLWLVTAVSAVVAAVTHPAGVDTEACATHQGGGRLGADTPLPRTTRFAVL